MTEIRLAGITKRYEKSAKLTISSLDLVIPPGELVVLVGPSGCGKSTTLRIIAGLEAPTSGDVFMGEKRVTEVPPSERDIAMVFQSYALYPHMTVFENLAFALRIGRLREPEIDRRVRAAADTLGLGELLARRPKELSGGQRQRVAIGRALVRSPKVFLLDEPLSNLDAQLRAEMRQEIARIHRQTGATSVYVTHDQVEAMTLADRIVVLRDGVTQQIGPPLELYDRPANRFVARFLGAPPMNMLTPAITEEAGQRWVDLGTLRVPCPDAREIVVGIRPEHVRLDPHSDARSLPARVDGRELMGADMYLHLDGPAGKLVARADGRRAVRVGDTLPIHLSPAHLHFFDAETGARL